MTKNKTELAVISLFTLAALAAVLLLTGCGHNICVQGFGLATPAGAVGYGSFHCVRENVRLENTKQKNGSDIQVVSRIRVGTQK